jgi:hypothetical protein
MPFSAVVTSTEHYWVTLAKRRRRFVCHLGFTPKEWHARSHFFPRKGCIASYIRIQSVNDMSPHDFLRFWRLSRRNCANQIAMKIGREDPSARVVS